MECLQQRWREDLNGRPPVIALDLCATTTPLGYYEAWPDLQGIDATLQATASFLRRDLWLRIAVNMQAEQIMVNWTLCNRFQHMLSIGPSSFTADRKKVKPSQTRDAWEVLLYNMPETDAPLCLGINALLPNGLYFPCQYMGMMETSNIVCDGQGHIYRQREALALPNLKFRRAIEKVQSFLIQKRCWGALNTRTMAYWFEPTATSRSIVAGVFQFIQAARMVDANGLKMPPMEISGQHSTMSGGDAETQAHEFVVEDASSKM